MRAASHEVSAATCAALALLRQQFLPTGAEALAEPFGAFPSWFLRITCGRCGKVQIVNEAHAPWRARTLHTILRRMRHDGCGGLAGQAELVTDADSASSRPVRNIVLRQ
jgi:hypothetical protein